jgi:hypothetical protein
MALLSLGRFFALFLNRGFHGLRGWEIKLGVAISALRSVPSV